MCAVNWTLLLEYFKVVFSWPPMAVVITLFAVFKFKAAIDDLLGRIVSGKILGQEIHAAPPKDAPQGAVTAPETFVPAIDGIAPAGDLARAAPAVEEPLPAELANDPMARDAIAFVRQNPVQTVIEYKKLVIALAAERLYAQIFGTQIALLSFLAGRNGEPATAAALAPYHLEYRQLSGNSEYSFEAYMHFLAVAGAVQKLEGETEQYRVTTFGADFLVYIKAQYPLVWSQRPF